MKKISVIVPCYNVEKYIDRCLSSLINQTMDGESFEIICVNDCSPDGTFEKLKAWERENPDRILLIDLPHNSRQGTARNTGLSHSSGDYIAFVDSDDWVESDYLERMYAAAVSGDYDVVQCELVRSTSYEPVLLESSRKSTDKENRSILITSIDERKAVFHSKIINNNPPRKLIKKSLLVENGIFFSEGLAYEDSYWGVLLNMYLKSAFLLEERLYHYYINPDSTVLTKNALYHMDLLTNQILLWEELKKRGFMEDFKEEIEIEHLYSCALIFWKMIALRYDEPPYSLYRLLCAIIKEHIPDIMDNSYMKKGELNEFQTLIFKSCLNELSRADFTEFANSVKMAYENGVT